MLSLPNDKSLYQNEDVVRAQCVALFHINDFKGLYNTLEAHTFSSEHHQFLQVSLILFLYLEDLVLNTTLLKDLLIFVGFVVQRSLFGGTTYAW